MGKLSNKCRENSVQFYVLRVSIFSFYDYSCHLVFVMFWSLKVEERTPKLQKFNYWFHRFLIISSKNESLGKSNVVFLVQPGVPEKYTVFDAGRTAGKWGKSSTPAEVTHEIFLHLSTLLSGDYQTDNSDLILVSNNSFCRLKLFLLQFFLGWWLLIDAISVYPHYTSAAHIILGILGTVSLVMVNSVSQAQVNYFISLLHGSNQLTITKFTR